MFGSKKRGGRGLTGNMDIDVLEARLARVERQRDNWRNLAEFQGALLVQGEVQLSDVEQYQLFRLEHECERWTPPPDPSGAYNGTVGPPAAPPVPESESFTAFVKSQQAK